MRKLVVGTFLTLDGVMQAPGGPDEDRDGGFEHGGWSVKYWDDMMGKLIVEQMLQPDALLLGRRTYEIFAAHWPRVTDPNDPVATKLNSVRKYVASRTLDKAEWNNSTLISHDAAAHITRLKEEPGREIQVSGSGNLIQTFLKHDLVDEFRLWIFPVVVGPGKRLFGSGTAPGALRLVDTKVSSTGVVIHRYERAGKLEYGSFEVDVAGSSSQLWSGNDDATQEVPRSQVMRERSAANRHASARFAYGNVAGEEKGFVASTTNITNPWRSVEPQLETCDGT